MLPTASLCIEPHKAAWVLYVDATCINYDGNVFDAALIAMVAALQNSAWPIFPPSAICADFCPARLPKAKFDEDTGRTTCSRKTLSPLQISRTPLAMSFGLFDSYVYSTVSSPITF